MSMLDRGQPIDRDGGAAGGGTIAAGELEDEVVVHLGHSAAHPASIVGARTIRSSVCRASDTRSEAAPDHVDPDDDAQDF